MGSVHDAGLATNACAWECIGSQLSGMASGARTQVKHAESEHVGGRILMLGTRTGQAVGHRRGPEQDSPCESFQDAACQE